MFVRFERFIELEPADSPIEVSEPERPEATEAMPDHFDRGDLSIWFNLLILLGIIVGILWMTVYAKGQVAVRKQGYVPFSDAPIHYLSDDLSDPVTRLRRKIADGSEKLEFDPKHGYLPSVLKKLDIPVSSQALVFSKTSFQYKKISPQTPRALYFNDDVYVGWVHDGKALEIVSFDPQKGAIFYIVDEKEVSNANFERAELDCTQCHVTSATRGIPGVFLRSIYPNPNGTQAFQAGSYVTGHESPLRERWGGWYVTGTHGGQRHMGNTFVTDAEHPQKLDRRGGGNLTDLSTRLDTSAYLSGHSDIVAQLVLAHQTQAHNLITLTNYQTRLALYDDPELKRPATRARIEGPAEELVKYLLFSDEIRLTAPIRGTSGFEAEFPVRGPRDSKGRSLRDFDLATRLFKHPLSYLVYSESFDALPEIARDHVYRRLFEVLTGKDQTPPFRHLSRVDRKAIFEILVETKSGLPEYWRQFKFNRSSPRSAKGRSRTAGFLLGKE